MSIFFKKRTAASVPTPAAGKVALFIDSTDSLTKTKDEAGTVLTLVPAAYNDESAQDAIGNALLDTNTVDFTYDDLNNTISAVMRIKAAADFAGASRVLTKADHGLLLRMSNGGAAMTVTLPTLTAADNGWWVKIENIDSAIAATITVSDAAGSQFGTTSNTSFTLQYMCRQGFVWNGTRWIYDTGNANLTKTPTAGTVVAGELPKWLDSTGRALVSSGLLAANIAQQSRQIATTAPLTGGGDLTADRTLAISAATPNAAGSQSATDKARQDNFARVVVNVLDFGAVGDGATACDTALTNAVAALGAGGGVVLFPAGTFLFNTAFVLAANNVRIEGVGPNATTLRTNSTTNDHFTISGYGSGIVECNIQGPGTGTTSNKTAGYGVNLTGVESFCNNCNFQYQWNALGLNGPLADCEEMWVRYFANTGIVVNQNSDHRITRVSMDNAAATLPLTAGIDVQLTASLQLLDLNIIHSNWALNVSPAAGVTIPSIKAANCFFDTSAIGLRMAGAGSVFRSEFTNCWFSSMSVAGILMAPTGAGTVDGITFFNCDIYNNVAGNTTGVSVTTALVGKWKMVGTSIAGWTVGIGLVAGTNHYPTLMGNTIGSVSAFGVNTTGIVVGAGAYKGLIISGNDCNDNTTVLTLGAATVAVAGNYRIIDNPGINPRGAGVTTPAVPASAALVTNSTGFRVLVRVKWGATTAPTALAINGVAQALPAAGTSDTFWLEPGSTFTYTSTVAMASWTWAGM